MKDELTLSQKVFGSSANMNHEIIIDLIVELAYLDEKKLVEELYQIKKNRQEK